MKVSGANNLLDCKPIQYKINEQATNNDRY